MRDCAVVGIDVGYASVVLNAAVVIDVEAIWRTGNREVSCRR